MTDEEWDEKQDALNAKLKPLLTSEFLSTLVEALRTCGHCVDMCESADFVIWCYNLAGQPLPERLTVAYMDEE